MQGRWKNQSDFFRRKINIAYFYILFAKSYSLSKVYGFERDKTYKRWIAIDENIVKVYTDLYFWVKYTKVISSKEGRIKI